MIIFSPRLDLLIKTFGARKRRESFLCALVSVRTEKQKDSSPEKKRHVKLFVVEKNAGIRVVK